jgi:hypothetical protein
MAHDHNHDHPGSGSLGTGADGFGGDDLDYLDYADIDIKEALGLPDELPPIRLLPLPELAARARRAPIPAQLAALAAWVGKDGREVDEDGDLTPEELTVALRDLGTEPEEFAFLWEYALAVEWLVFEGADEDRVAPGETAGDWASEDDERVFAAWSSTLAAVLSETLAFYGPESDLDEDAEDDAEDDEEGDEDEFDFTGQGMAIAILLFLARREGLSTDEFAEVLWENAAGVHDDDDEDVHEDVELARERWEADFGDPAALLLAKMRQMDAIIETDDVIRLSPLALAALHEQLVEAGVEIPLLPQTAAELSGSELLAMAEGISDAEFEAEADAWTAARGSDAAARDLLELAAQGDPGQRMLAVAAVTRIGPPAEAALRDSLTVPAVRGYAKVALISLGGIDVAIDPDATIPPELELAPDDLAWVATDLLALACDDEYPDPDDLAVSFREAVPLGQEPELFETMARGTHPDAEAVLVHLGKYHPDKNVAKAARTAAHKAASRRS